MSSTRKSTFQKHFGNALQYFGLAHPAEGTPLPGAPRTSRYGAYSSPRLDQDIDALQRRIAELEARLDGPDPRSPPSG